MRGYFFDGSNAGGLTIQPWTFRLSLEDSYQISSTFPSSRAPRRSSFTAVIGFSDGLASVPTAMSPGTSGRERVAAKFPFAARLKDAPPAYALRDEPMLPVSFFTTPSSVV